MVAAASPRVRMVALGVALAGLLAAPATWSAQTLGHATNGTFPAGGPASAGLRRRGRRHGRTARRRQPARSPRRDGGAAASGRRHGDAAAAAACSAATPPRSPPPSPTSRPTAAAPSASPASRARPRRSSSRAPNVAGLGGFSGRESEVTVAWLKQAVAEGKIRWVLVDGNTGMGPQDGRTGATTVMDWVQSHGKKVTSSGLY